MEKVSRSWLDIKLDASKRYVMWNYLSGKLDLVLLSEFPKSGASWLSSMLSDTLNVPYPRDRMPQLRSSIMHGHHLYNDSFGKTICLLRDGRDIMVSAYYGFLVDHNRAYQFALNNNRSIVSFTDYENVEKNLPEFIECIFNKKKSLFNKGFLKFTWNEFIHSYYNNKEKVLFIKYEDLLEDSAKQLMRAIKFLNKPERSYDDLKKIADKYSFKKITNRNPGEENTKSFVRKGIAGDWKNKFSKEACQMFDHYAGKELILAGYEKDHNWY